MTQNIPAEHHTITLDPDRLARQIAQIAESSRDPDAAERLAGIAQMLLGNLQARDAWLMSVYTLVGRCDMAFEMIETARLLSTAKRTAKQLRAEIKKASRG